LLILALLLFFETRDGQPAPPAPTPRSAPVLLHFTQPVPIQSQRLGGPAGCRDSIGSAIASVEVAVYDLTCCRWSGVDVGGAARRGGAVVVEATIG
jgi:hypothetical protein